MIQRVVIMSEIIRIAQVLNRMDSGGIEMVLMNYYRHIDRDKVQFDFYYADDSTFVQKEEMKQLGARTYPIPAYSKPIQFHRELYQAFKEHKYQIVHVCAFCSVASRGANQGLSQPFNCTLERRQGYTA